MAEKSDAGAAQEALKKSDADRPDDRCTQPNIERNTAISKAAEALKEEVKKLEAYNKEFDDGQKVYEAKIQALENKRKIRIAACDSTTTYVESDSEKLKRKRRWNYC